MTITVSINGREVVNVHGNFTLTNSTNTASQFHDIARITHHAIDKAFKDLTTVKLEVKK